MQLRIVQEVFQGNPHRRALHLGVRIIQSRQNLLRSIVSCIRLLNEEAAFSTCA